MLVVNSRFGVKALIDQKMNCWEKTNYVGMIRYLHDVVL